MYLENLHGLNNHRDSWFEIQNPVKTWRKAASHSLAEFVITGVGINKYVALFSTQGNKLSVVKLALRP